MTKVQNASIKVPGKALILGEYAVLEQHPALVMAVDRYFHCSITIENKDQHQIIAKPILEKPQAFSCHQEQLKWQDTDNFSRLAFIAPLFEALGIATTLSANGTSKKTINKLSFELDSSGFYHHDQTDNDTDPIKLGLGSSAALSVAIALAWQQHQHPNIPIDLERWLPLLVKVHHDLQGGKGSGADVAASLYGGLIEYRIDREQTPSVKPTAWPNTLDYCWIWMGQSASTRVFLRSMADFKQNNMSTYQKHMQHLGQIAAQGITATEQGSGGGLQLAIAEYGAAMQALGEAAGANIYTDAHRRLQILANRHKVAFKPSGAGGGDIALAAATDSIALAAFAAEAKHAGYPILSLNQANPGH